MVKVSMRDMLKAGVHYGHNTRYWDPKMEEYIYGSRDKVHIINLEHTLPMFRRALEFVETIGRNKGKLLFVGTKFSAADIIVEEANRAKMPFVDHRWLGGMLTNYITMRQRVRRLKKLEEMRDNGTFDTMIKKEALQLSKELEKLDRSIGGIKKMAGLPDAIYIVDVGHENIAIAEANKLNIPVIGIVDTNCNTEGVTYPIPGNDDAMSAIRLYSKAIADTLIEARASVMETKPVVKKKEEKVEVAAATSAGTESTEADPASSTSAGNES